MLQASHPTLWAEAGSLLESNRASSFAKLGVSMNVTSSKL